VKAGQLMEIPTPRDPKKKDNHGIGIRIHIWPEYNDYGECMGY
jgi:hypothetical protein